MIRRGSPLLWAVGTLLAATTASVAVVSVEVVRASRATSAHSGLDYRHFLRALDDLVAGAGAEELVRFDEVEMRLPGGGRAAWDTLVVLADPAAFPSFRRGGFLHDQVAAYNAFQRERAALARTQPEWFDRLQAHNPSVLRSYRTADGRALTRSAAAWSLRVRSPAEEEWDGEVRARDVHRGNALLGPRVAVPLRRPVRFSRRVDGRSQMCEFTPDGLEVRAYCLSEERIPQAVLRMASDGAPGSARAGWADLWVDGDRVAAGDSVPLRTGAVVRINPLEPVVVGEYWEGVLSSKQWISGRMRRRSAFAPPLDLFAALGTRPAVAGPATSASASVDLSVDAGASLELTTRLRGFLEREVPLDLDFGIAVIARVPDGEILAIAEVGNRRSRGRSNLLERVTPGSAVKPLLAAAVLSRRPELASLAVRARTGPVRSVLGMPPVPASRAFRTALNCPAPDDGWVDLVYFLRCSNNEYAASLLVAGLWDGESMAPSAGGIAYALGGEARTRGRPALPLEGRAVPRGALLRSPLSEGLTDLFDVPADPVVADALGRSDRVWGGLAFSDGTPVRVPLELMPTESRPALLAPRRPEGTDLSLLYRYAFGAWENGWTLLDLTNGFARVVTDRRLQLRFVPGGAQPPPHRPGPSASQRARGIRTSSAGSAPWRWTGPRPVSPRRGGGPAFPGRSSPRRAPSPSPERTDRPTTSS